MKKLKWFGFAQSFFYLSLLSVSIFIISGCASPSSDNNSDNNGGGGNNGDGGGNITGGSSPFDLSITNTTTKSTTNKGENFNLSFTITNNGEGNSVATAVVFYRSSDNIIGNNNDTSFDSQPLGAIAAGNNQPISISVTGNATSYYYWACITPQQRETNSNNNCSSTKKIIVLFDLSITNNNTTTSTTDVKANFNLSFTITNNGAGNSVPTAVVFYRSSDNIIGNNNDTSFDSQPLGIINARNTQAVSTTVTVNATSYYWACITLQQGETNNNNNCSSTKKITVLFDLSITNITTTSTADVNTNFNLSFTITNDGTVDSVPTAVVFYRSSDNIIGNNNDTSFDNQPLDSIAAGHNRVITTKDSVDATSYYWACITPQQEEINKNNNCSSTKQITVLFPNLAIKGLLRRNAPRGGESISFATVLENTGAGNANSIILDFYRSDASTVNTSGNPLATHRTSLKSNSSNLVVSYLPSIPYGTKYYKVCERLSFENHSDCSDATAVTSSLLGFRHHFKGESELISINSMTTAQIGEKTFLFSASFSNDIVTVFEVAENGSLHFRDSTNDNNTLQLNGAESVVTAQVAGKTFLFVAGSNDGTSGPQDDGVSVFEVSGDGKLTNKFNVTDNDNGSYKLNGATSLVTTQIGGKTFLFVAGLHDNGISVFEVSTDGSLSNTDNVNYSSIYNNNITTAKIGGKTFLLIGESGFAGKLSMAEVSAEGRVFHKETITGNDTYKLNYPNGITTAKIEQKTFIFVSASNHNGINVFEVSTDTNGNGNILENTYKFVGNTTGVYLGSPGFLTTAQIGSKKYLFVISGYRVFSAPDGVSVFEISSNGDLHNVANEGLGSLGINGDSNEMTIGQAGGKNFLFIAGQSTGAPNARAPSIATNQIERAYNYSFQTALDIQKGRSYSENLAAGKKNYYLLYLPAINKNTSIFSTIGTTSLHCSLYNDDQTQNGREDNDGGNCNISRSSLSAGYYYIRITGASDNISGNYTLVAP